MNYLILTNIFLVGDMILNFFFVVSFIFETTALSFFNVLPYSATNSNFLFYGLHHEQPLWIKCKVFIQKYMLFIDVHKELGNLHFLQPHKLLSITFNKRFETNNLLNQLWNKWKELCFHESFHEVSKNKSVCCFELFEQVVERSVCLHEYDQRVGIQYVSLGKPFKPLTWIKMP